MNFREKLKNFADYDHFSEFHITFCQKLTLLLHQTCKIDLSHMDVENPHYFKLNDNSTPFMALYDFTYDNEKKVQAIIKLKDAGHNDILNVYFKFGIQDAHPTLPAGAYFVNIDVNNNLEYQSACFESRFYVGWSNKITKQLTKATILIKRNINSELKTSTTIEYFTTGRQPQNILFNNGDLPNIFFANDNRFYEPLMKILFHCEHNPAIFHTIFTEYSSQVSLSTSIEGFKSLLKQYHTDYYKNLSLLTARLLLIDMHNI